MKSKKQRATIQCKNEEANDDVVIQRKYKCTRNETIKQKVCDDARKQIICSFFCFRVFLFRERSPTFGGDNSNFWRAAPTFKGMAPNSGEGLRTCLEGNETLPLAPRA